MDVFGSATEIALVGVSSKASARRCRRAVLIMDRQRQVNRREGIDESRALLVCRRAEILRRAHDDLLHQRRASDSLP